PADAPTDNAEAVDHRRVRIRPDERVRVVNAVALDDALRQVFEIDLMTDADARRDNAKTIERLRAPFQELITRTIAPKLRLHVQAQSVGTRPEINLHRMINHEINRHERLDDLW